MKTKVRIITVLAVVVACLFATCIPSLASGKLMYDELGLFTESERVELAAIADSELSSNGVSFSIVTHSGGLRSNSYYMDLTDSSYSSPKIILVIRKNGSVYNYDMFTYGDADYSIDNVEIDRILDSDGVYDSIKSGKVYEGAKEFIALSGRAASGSLRAPFYTYLLPCGIIALIAVIITVSVIIARYKTKLKSPSYPLDRYARLNLISSNDLLVDTIVTRVRINTGSRGGRGGGGHRGGR